MAWYEVNAKIIFEFDHQYHIEVDDNDIKANEEIEAAKQALLKFSNDRPPLGWWSFNERKSRADKIRIEQVVETDENY